ncbi:MAG: PKD domain-containing protein [Chitinophagaceae bacterium]|nr:PKD domain-containing protein [Chitinophagaceae bacterium]
MRVLIATILTVLTLQSFCQCDPSFTYIITQHQVYFNPGDSITGKNHLWHFGDGNSSSEIYGFNSYSKPGSYQVTHIVHDSLTNCTDSLKQTITLSYTPQCHIAFYYQFSFPNFRSVNFYPSSIISGTTITQYTWKINDTVAFTSEYPGATLNFNAPGSYQVCLEINTSSGCTSSYCETVNIMYTCKTKSDFSYTAGANNARYIEFVPTPDNPDLRYLWLTNQSQQFYGYHEFPQAGKYEVTMFITDSIKNCYDSVKKVIDVKGNRYDSCTVSYTHRTDQDIQHQLILSASSNQPIVNQYWAIENEHGFSDSIITTSGDPVKYLFPDTGSYNITLRVVTNSGCNRTYTDTIHVTNIQKKSSEKTLVSYPNPANNYILLPFIAESNGTIQLSIYNSMGKLVQTERKTIVKGNNQIRVSLQSIAKGQYYVHIQFNNSIFKSRFQKI